MTSPRILQDHLAANGLDATLPCAAAVGANFKLHLNSALVAFSPFAHHDVLRKTAIFFNDRHPHTTVQCLGWLDGEILATQLPGAVPKFVDQRHRRARLRLLRHHRGRLPARTTGSSRAAATAASRPPTTASTGCRRPRPSIPRRDRRLHPPPAARRPRRGRPLSRPRRQRPCAGLHGDRHRSADERGRSRTARCTAWKGSTSATAACCRAPAG